ncbi:MAG: hypothetical protein JKX70_07210 [Phycisphaerales bacterium]|nr:hypothetical protein [Phycisphaerales bacterium]
MPDAPKIQGWVRWFDRDGLDGIDCPGVYLIARFESGPPESVNPSDKHVVYIGETCRTLRERLRAFNRAAHDGKSKHSGGRRFHQVFGDDAMESTSDMLFVAVIAVEQAEPHSSAYIRYTERRLILEFVTANDRLPVCNGK